CGNDCFAEPPRLITLAKQYSHFFARSLCPGQRSEQHTAHPCTRQEGDPCDAIIKDGDKSLVVRAICAEYGSGLPLLQVKQRLTKQLLFGFEHLVDGRGGAA